MNTDDSNLKYLMELSKEPPSFFKMEDYDFCINERNMVCGDNFSLYVKLNNNRIEDVSFWGQGCTLSTLSFCFLIQKIKNININDLEKIEETDILKEFNIKIGKSKKKCALMSVLALNSLIEKINENEKDNN